MEERQSYQSDFANSFDTITSISTQYNTNKRVTPTLLGSYHLHATSANRLCEGKNEIVPQFSTATSLKDAIALEVSGKLSSKKVLTPQ